MKLMQEYVKIWLTNKYSINIHKFSNKGKIKNFIFGIPLESLTSMPLED